MDDKARTNRGRKEGGDDDEDDDDSKKTFGIGFGLFELTKWENFIQISRIKAGVLLSSNNENKRSI